MSVNTETEHQFVNNWFAQNDNNPDERNMWYTSGYREPSSLTTSPTFLWLDGTTLGSMTRWRNPEAPQTDTGDYITYTYEDTGVHEDQPGFFWVRDQGALPRAFICEISKINAEKINSKDRDFCEYI